MSLERWHQQIRGRQNETGEDKFHVTEPEPVDGAPDLQVRYISIGEGGYNGLPEGVYVQTNVTPEGYESDFNLRSVIRTHICLSLMDKKRTPSVGVGPELDLLNAISYTPAFVAPNGAIVLRLEPALPSQVDQAMGGLKDGTSRGAIVPNPRLGR